MPRSDRRRPAPTSDTRKQPMADAPACGSSMAGILACLGALAEEAQELGETSAAAVLLEAADRLRQTRSRGH